MSSRLGKRQLFRTLFRALEAGGAQITCLNSENSFPREFIASFADGAFSRSIVYLWNCTYDEVNHRPRFQVTGVDSHHFLFTPGVDTFLMGYDSERQVFAVADPSRRHAGFGASPSVYIPEPTLDAAHATGMASYDNVRGETIIAVRSVLASVLFRAPQAIHEIARQSKGSLTLQALSTPTEKRPRQRARMLVSRAVRDARFPGMVLPAYDHRCAVCGMQLRFVEAAHIIPVSSGTWDDEINNGIALCVLHHRAYDSGVMLINGDYSVEVNKTRARALTQSARGAGLAEFRRGLPSQIVLPRSIIERPSPAKLDAGARLRSGR